MKKKRNKGAGIMPDYESKKAWDKENVVFVTTKLFKSTDADILEYLDGKVRATEIKRALRLLIETEKKEAGE